MKVLTAAEMREVDRLTIERGIPGLILMENAGHRVVEFLAARFAPLSQQRIVVFCGKGNNGGDALVVARQLYTRLRPRSLDIVFVTDPAELQGDATANFRMLTACGCQYSRAVTPPMRFASLVIDGLLGTGLRGPVTSPFLEAIREINTGFSSAKVVAIDVPSGLPSDSGEPSGEFVRAHYTVTFTAPKVAHALPPSCHQMGELIVAPIGSPPELYTNVSLSLAEPADFRELLAPRPPGAHKGDFGHVLVVGGASGKAGAAAMSGLAALRAGAGLVTVACSAPDLIPLTPALMTASLRDARSIRNATQGKRVVAIGPGLGDDPELVNLTRTLVAECELPIVVDADGLNALAPSQWTGGGAQLRVLTPHPGEMSRLTGKSTQNLQADRLGAARALAKEKRVCVVLKGNRTIVAFPDGTASINPTGTPALATAGTGDILTGLIAGFLSQFPDQSRQAIIAAVYLHGLAGELGACSKGEKSLIATDLLDFLPAAIKACAQLPDSL